MWELTTPWTSRTDKERKNSVIRRDKKNSEPVFDFGGTQCQTGRKAKRPVVNYIKIGRG